MSVANSKPVLRTDFPGFPVRRGKVRDVYDLGNRLLIVSTDRISAFDWVLPSGIPDKGRILTQLSKFWFELLREPSHFITADVDRMELPPAFDRAIIAGRSMLVHKANVVPFECVVRGYLAGSGWKEYQRGGTVCGLKLPSGLRECDKLPEPIFTPATKAESGHDENVSFDVMAAAIGRAKTEQLRHRSIEVYRRGSEHAATKGVIIADTKFEWGERNGEIILIDEVLTPDSSRFWPGDQYQPGHGQASFDKQFVRDWLETTGWDKQSEPPQLPDDVAEKTRAKYVAAYELLTGTTWT